MVALSHFCHRPTQPQHELAVTRLCYLILFQFAQIKGNNLITWHHAANQPESIDCDTIIKLPIIYKKLSHLLFSKYHQHRKMKNTAFSIIFKTIQYVFKNYAIKARKIFTLL